LISKAQSSRPLAAEGEGSLQRAALIREQIERIVISPGFVNSARMCQFLRFVVENSIAYGERFKETVIGVEVFGRAPGYDPSLEPIVRIEARRLRDKLEQYYAGQGANDPVVITLPKGGYKPEFSFQEAPTLRVEQEQPELSVPVPITDDVQNGAASERLGRWIRVQQSARADVVERVNRAFHSASDPWPYVEMVRVRVDPVELLHAVDAHTEIAAHAALAPEPSVHTV